MIFINVQILIAQLQVNIIKLVINLPMKVFIYNMKIILILFLKYLIMIQKKELQNFNLDSEEKILSFFRTYFKYYNETCEIAKNKFEKLYPLINIKDKELQNKINNVFFNSQRKNKDSRSVLDKILDISNSKEEKLSKLYEYTSKKNKDIKKYFIIISNKKIRNDLKSNSLKSIHFDTTYKCVTPTPKKMRLLVVSGFDELNNRTCIWYFILIMDKKEETFLEIFKVLREEPYHMNLLYMMSDFALGQIKAVNKIYPNILYNGCFFHLSQCIWKKIQYYGLRGKVPYKNNMTILFNL